MYNIVKLPNGARIILNDMPGMESAVIGVWVTAGSRNENKNISGISHFLEHMVFKGTPSRSTRDVKEEIEGRGGSLNGFTSEELTCYLAKVSHLHIDIAIDVLSDITLNARLDDADIERERNVIIEEIKMYEDIPSHAAHDLLSEIMWPGHPLGFNIAGTIGTVSSIKKQGLESYRNTNYIPKNLIIVLCGNLKNKPLLEKLKSSFSAPNSSLPDEVEIFKNKQTEPCIKILYKDTAQSHLTLGLHTFGRPSEDRYALNLLHIILGANMSSRLFENLREQRGLVYEIGTGIKKYRDTGAFVVDAGMEHEKVEEGISIILKELKKIKSEPVPEKELIRAKEFFKVQVLLALEDTMEHMLWLGEKIASHDALPDKLDIMQKINAVTEDDLKRVANLIFRKASLNIALVGPLKEQIKKSVENMDI